MFAHRFRGHRRRGVTGLDGVPPGTYTLAVWNETVCARSAAADGHIGDAGGDVEVDFSDPMNPFTSLTNRIFFATALLVTLSMGVVIFIVNRAVTRQGALELQRNVDQDADAGGCAPAVSLETFGRDARLIADFPMLKAAVDTHDPATVEQVRGLPGQLPNTQLFAIADNRGVVLRGWAPAMCRTRRFGGRRHHRERPAPSSGRLLAGSARHPPDQIGPDLIDRRQPDVLGTLILGASPRLRAGEPVQGADEQRRIALRDERNHQGRHGP